MQLRITDLTVIDVPDGYAFALELLVVQVMKRSVTGNVNVAIRGFTQIDEAFSTTPRDGQ